MNVKALARPLHARRQGRPIAFIVLLGSLLLSPAAAGRARAASPVVPDVRDVAAPAGIAQTTQTWSATVNDFNGDGWPDFFLSRHGQHPGQLWVNQKDGTFTEADQGVFGQHDRHGCVSADVNGDHKPDVFCGIGAKNGTDVKSNELWIQGPGLSFTDRNAAYGVADPYGRARHSTFIDVNHDGFPDLFVGNTVERPDGLPTDNKLFLNQGGDAFAPAPDLGVDREIGARCARAADYNGDGWEDLLVCTDQDRGLRLYRNDGGTGFTDVSGSVGLTAADDVPDAALADLDGDGRPDLVEVFSNKVTVRLQKDDGTFGAAVYSRALQTGGAVAVADVNADGHPDLYVLQAGKSTNDPDVMLLNDGDGRSFTQMTVPEATGGIGDTAVTIDYDRNGYDDVLVLNGSGADGPIQLLAFFPPGGGGPSGSATSGSTAADAMTSMVTGEASPASETPPLRPASRCGPSWSLVPPPNQGGGDNALAALSPLAADDLWAVGRYSNGGTQRTLAQHWDATGWTPSLPLNFGNNDNGLTGVAAVSSDEVWAVGRSLGGGTTTLVERWTGPWPGSWARVSSPNPNLGNSLTGVAATGPGDIWSVGFYWNGTTAYRTLAIHWDGHAWTKIDTVDPGAGDNVLIGVAAVRPNAVWAVGRSSPGSGTKALVERWNGSAWRVVDLPPLGSGESVLTAVSADSTSDVWAVGYRMVGNDAEPLTLHDDGSGWTVVPAPAPAGVFDALRGVTVLSAQNAWAVGVTLDQAAGRYRTLTLHWDGSRWSLVPSLDVVGDNELVGVSSVSGEPWTVGAANDAGSALAEHLCPVKVTDTGFSPSTVTVTQGAGVVWTFSKNNTGPHRVTDASGLGLFDSGLRPPGGSFDATLTAAGTYPVADPTTGAAGTVKVPVTATPGNGSTSTTFTITWAGSPAASGFVYDVQIRRPGAKKFVDWLTGVGAPGKTFVPDGGTGTYAFRARLRETGGAATGWSPPASIAVQ